MRNRLGAKARDGFTGTQFSWLEGIVYQYSEVNAKSKLIIC